MSCSVSQDITLPTKVHIVKVMVFPVVMCRCESWAIKKAEHWGTDAFELWYWRRFLRVPWTARRLNQSILKEINTEYSLEGLMLKLKLQYFGYLRRRANSLEKTLMQLVMASPTQWTWVWTNSGRWWRTGKPGVLQSMGSQRVGHGWATEQQQCDGNYEELSAGWNKQIAGDVFYWMASPDWFLYWVT